MPTLTLSLGARQSAYFASADGARQSKLFFSAELSKDASIGGKPFQHTTSVEVIQDNSNGSIGALAYCDAQDAYGKPTQTTGDLTLNLADAIFEQLANAGLTTSTVLLNIKTSEPNSAELDKSGTGELEIISLRISFIPREDSKPEEAGLRLREVSGKLDRLLWIAIVIAGLILWRLH